MPNTSDMNTHLCAFCFKVYRRHDLLIRHRRRCKGPKKPATRRKVCNACAEAKSRCNTETPCVRCRQRGVPCEYVNQPPGLQDTNWASERSDTMVGRHLSHMEAAGLDNQDSPWNSTSMTQGATTDSSMHIDPSIPLWDFPLSGLGPPSNIEGLYESVFFNDEQRQSSFRTLLDELMRYPQLLLRHDFESPFAHYSLFDNDVPDMATLEKSATAICCGSALATTDASHFARHMMNLERERLIESYPAYQCMHQWDALHAMLVYEILELTISSNQAKDSWKKRAQSRGLRAPFLAKMTREFIQSHSNPDSNLTPRSNIGENTFAEWGVAETARRTIFLSNIVHFFSNHHMETEEPSLYYEPLDDDFILNMPLPSTSHLWMARTDNEWKGTMEYQLDDAFSFDHDISAIGIAPSQFTLKQILAKFSKEELKSWAIQGGVGLEGSDALRNFIILCALEQYGLQNGPEI